MNWHVFRPWTNRLSDTFERLAVRTLEQAPSAFWSAPASSSGKYHPECARGKHGLIVHTRRVCWLAEQFDSAGFIGMGSYDTYGRDAVLLACLVHDTHKPVDYKLHAQKSAEALHTIAEAEAGGRPQAVAGAIAQAVSAVWYHMGPWTEVDRKPMEAYTPIERVVYAADYLASRPELATPVDRM